MALPGTSYAARTRRYVLAAVGPVAVAGANFLLSFSMLRLERPEVFGAFTFLFVAALFTIAVSSALFGAPMQALYSGAETGGSQVVATVLSAAVAAALVVGAGFAMLGFGQGLAATSAACYGAFAMLTMLRGIGRAWAYVVERPWRVALGDISYALVTLGSFASAVRLGHAAPADAIYPALAIGSAAALAGLGRRFIALLLNPRWAALREYGGIWRGQSRWSLLGVVATEAAANAHIYLLTLLAGAAAVAPVAASALLVRPINVVQNALVEYERPQLARLLRAGDRGEVARSIRWFRIVLLLAWGGTIALAVAILRFDPALVFPQGYDLATVRLAAAFWTILWLVIVLQVPPNVLLQARGDFRTLALASLVAGMISVAGILAAILLGQPVWTIAAIIPGWIVSTAMITRAVRKPWTSRGALR